MMGMLDTLSPLKVVDRGYSIATVKKAVVKSVKGLKKGDHLDVKVSDGVIKTEILEISNEP
jgi:exodeoxyribonuclease VII large subunit